MQYSGVCLHQHSVCPSKQTAQYRTDYRILVLLFDENMCMCNLCATRWRSRLRHWASRKVAGSIPDGIIDIFH